MNSKNSLYSCILYLGTAIIILPVDIHVGVVLKNKGLARSANHESEESIMENKIQSNSRTDIVMNSVLRMIILNPLILDPRVVYTNFPRHLLNSFQRI